MKILRCSVVVAVLAAAALPCAHLPLTAQQAPARAVRARVDSLLARMTLEEKVGQMTQLDLNNFLAQGGGRRRRTACGWTCRSCGGASWSGTSARS